MPKSQEDIRALRQLVEGRQAGEAVVETLSAPLLALVRDVEPIASIAKSLEKLVPNVEEEVDACKVSKISQHTSYHTSYHNRRRPTFVSIREGDYWLNQQRARRGQLWYVKVLVIRSF